MRALCPEAVPKFGATLPNYKLVFTGWSRTLGGGTATIKRAEHQRVLGGIYEVSDKCLAALDRFEGHPTTFSRMNVIVFSDAAGPVEAFTYIRVAQAEETKPSPQYLAILQQGYKDWGII